MKLSYLQKCCSQLDDKRGVFFNPLLHVAGIAAIKKIHIKRLVSVST